MSIHRSARYEEIHDKVWDQFVTPPEDERHNHWWRVFAPRWRNRVGLPRLVAETAAHEVSEVLRSINPGLFRNDPEMLTLLREAQRAADEFSVAMGRDSWRRFDGDVKEEEK